MKSLKRKKVVLVAVAVIAICLLSIYAPTMYAYYYVGLSRQGVTFHINAVDIKGKPVPYFRVHVFLLTDKGPIQIGSAGAFASGRALVHIFIPRIARGFLWERKPYLENGRVVYKLVESNRPVYVSVNIGVIVSSPDGKIGARILPLDPTFMKWPEDNVYLTVKLRKPPQSGNVTRESINHKGKVIAEDDDTTISWWQYTPVLRYATWDSISAWFDFKVGSKIEIQSKQMICGLWSCSNWEDAGSTQVTLDAGISGGKITGHVVRTVYLYVKYIDWYYYDTFAGVTEEIIYAADTSMDPHGTKFSDNYWDGRLPASPYYYTFPQDATLKLPITGGYHWDLSVNIGASIGVGSGGPSASLYLGVTIARIANPQAILYVQAGHKGEGEWKVKVVSLHGAGSGSYVVVYSNWIQG